MAFRILVPWLGGQTCAPYDGSMVLLNTEPSEKFQQDLHFADEETETQKDKVFAKGLTPGK